MWVWVPVRGGSINRNRNRDYFKNRNRYDYTNIIEEIDNRWKNNRNRDYFSISSSIEKVYLKSKCALLCPNYKLCDVFKFECKQFYVTQRIELHTVSTRLSRHIT
jgi:hypothetical protein